MRASAEQLAAAQMLRKFAHKFFSLLQNQMSRINEVP
jgi:hypothetical protein